MAIEMIEEFDQGTQIKVIGVGGGGGNAVQHMIGQGVQGVDFIVANTDEELLSAEWERVRHGFTNDSRTIGELEALTGKSWIVTRRGESIGNYAERKWDGLRTMRGIGLKKIRGLVEILSAVAKL